MLFSPMSLFVRLVTAALWLGEAFRFLLLEVRRGNILVQRVLVLLQGENVVRLLVANLAGNGPLTASGVNGDDGVLDHQSPTRLELP